jgi:hypothetical protein
MIAAAGLLAGLFIAAAPTPASPPTLSPAVVLQRYAAALAAVKEPAVITFDYTLEQTGRRMLEQTHRVFRAGNDERDETLTVDGKRLDPPKVRIFRGRRNRYTLALLAPRVTDYDFVYVGPHKDVRHIDYVFRLTPKAPRTFAVTTMTIDGVRFLPVSIGFATTSNAGTGSIAFGSIERWWVPYAASARATVAAEVATEHLNFYTYRFPRTLPPSTFSQAHRVEPAEPPSGTPPPPPGARRARER